MFTGLEGETSRTPRRMPPDLLQLRSNFEEHPNDPFDNNHDLSIGLSICHCKVEVSSGIVVSFNWSYSIQAQRSLGLLMGLPTLQPSAKP